MDLDGMDNTVRQDFPVGLFTVYDELVAWIGLLHFRAILGFIESEQRCRRLVRIQVPGVHSSIAYGELVLAYDIVFQGGGIDHHCSEG